MLTIQDYYGYLFPVIFIVLSNLVALNLKDYNDGISPFEMFYRTTILQGFSLLCISHLRLEHSAYSHLGKQISIPENGISLDMFCSSFPPSRF